MWIAWIFVVASTNVLLCRNALCWRASGQQPWVLLTGHREDNILQSQLSIFLFSPHDPLFFCLFYRKRHLTAPAQVTTDSSLKPASWMWSTENLLLSSSVNRGNTSVPCLFTFSTCQKRSKSVDYSARPKKNSIRAVQWKQYHPYFKQLAPNRGNLTLGCQLFYFSGFCSKPL